MSTKVLLSTGLAIAVGIFTLASVAHAESAPTAPAPPTAIKGEFAGKAICKTEKQEGKEVMTATLMVTEGKAADGKLLSDVKGRTLTATGPKAMELHKLNGKDVIVRGTLSADRKSIDVESAVLKPMPHKPAAHTSAPAK